MAAKRSNEEATAESPPAMPRMLLTSLAAKLGLDSPSKSKEKDALAEALAEAAKEHGGVALGTPSTVASTPGTGSAKKPKGARNGKGGQKKDEKSTPKKKLSFGTAAEGFQKQLDLMKHVVLVMCRLVCAHAQEFRRIAREENTILAFPRKSHMPAKLAEEKKLWKEEAEKEKVARDLEFALHPEGPWRFRAFKRVGEEIAAFAATNRLDPDEDTQALLTKAVTVVSNVNTQKDVVQRFWLLHSKMDEDPDEDEDEDQANAELWVLRVSNSSSGNRMGQALALLHQHDVLDKALRGAELRQGRAPKGSLQRSLEGLLEGELPKKTERKNSKKD